MKSVVCIAGPTASGKSAWAVSLAKTLDGEIINADALQVYKDLRILSARPSDAEMVDVPHHLFGHVPGHIRYSVGAWLDEAVPVILDVLSRHKTPLIVGGTGLYFKALTEGLAEIPQPSPGAMTSAQSLLDSQGIAALRAEAEARDPAATARVLGDDPQRLLRIVSVATGTDKPLSEWQRETKPVIPRGYWQGAVLLPERQSLYDKINARYQGMVEGGGLDEARAILAKNYAPNLPVMKAIGLSPLLEHLRGGMSLETTLERSMRDTRRFAKRQFTWLRGQTPHWTKIETREERTTFLKNIPCELG